MATASCIRIGQSLGANDVVAARRCAVAGLILTGIWHKLTRKCTGELVVYLRMFVVVIVIVVIGGGGGGGGLVL